MGNMRDLVKKGYYMGNYSGLFRSGDILRPFERDIFSMFESLAKPSGSVLDLGCGTGIPYGTHLIRRGLMTALEFHLALSIISLAMTLWAIRLSLKGNALLLVLTKSIQTIETRSRAKRNGSSKTLETTKQKEIQLKEQTEQRKALELELKRQQQEWKKKKDAANLVKWFSDRLENDED